MTMPPAALFVVQMCYNLFIYLTEREQLEDYRRQARKKKKKQPGPVLLYFKNCSMLLWQLIFLK